MATKEEHIKKAQHNERFVGQFDIATTPFLDWVITGIFYSALHYIRALASKHLFINISNYGQMDNVFTRLSLLKNNQNVFFDYRQLKDDSRAARYDMKQFSVDETTLLIKEEFERIKSFVKAHL